MIETDVLQRWFCREILPLEASLSRFIRRFWRAADEISDIRQDVYEKALIGASRGLPSCPRAYLFTIARNVMYNRARHARVISLDVVADLENVPMEPDMLTPERHAEGREALSRARAGIDRLPPRCREVMVLRKVEGLSTREVAERLGVGIDAVEQQTTYGIRALTDFMLGGEGRIQRPRRGSRVRKGRLS